MTPSPADRQVAPTAKQGEEAAGAVRGRGSMQTWGPDEHEEEQAALVNSVRLTCGTMSPMMSTCGVDLGKEGQDEGHEKASDRGAQEEEDEQHP